MQRDLRVDVLRFVALVSMFVAHCAPASPIQKVTQLSEFLTAALFAGAMTLTMYVLQIAWLAHYVRVLHPGKSDDTWLNVVGMSLGAMVLAAVWHAVVRWQPWRRGPLEGPVDFVVRAVQRVLP